MSKGHDEERPYAGGGGCVAPSDGLLARLIDTLELPVCYVDSEERYRYGAPAYEELVGHPAEELLGRRIRDVVGEVAYEKFQHRLAEGLSGEQTSFQVRLPLSEGGAGDMEATYVPDVGPGGEVDGFFAHVRDVTALNEAEAALRESEERYRHLFQRDLSGNFVSTPDGEFIDCNPAFARMFGFASVEEALRSNVRSLYNDPRERETLLERIRSEGQVHLLEETLQDVRGRPVHVIENWSARSTRRASSASSSGT